MAWKNLTKDVTQFTRECASIIGDWESERFSIRSLFYFQDNPIESPIEQIFTLAFLVLCRTNRVDMDLFPQFEIGKYRVDFLANYDGVKHVIVECDSQEFHERTEAERRYEKARDRFLQITGHKIFHFTGKEIKERPFHVAGEVIAYLLDKKTDEVIDVNYIRE